MDDSVRKNLVWYYNVSASAMGFSSNFYNVINSTPGSTPSVNPEKIIFHLKAIRKHRKIHAALSRLSQDELRYVSALFDDEYQSKYPPVIKSIFNGKTGLALCLYDDLEKLLKLCSNKRHGDAINMELEKLIRLTEKTYEELYEKLEGSL